MRIATPRQWRVLWVGVRFAALIGGAFGAAAGAATLKPTLLGAALGALSGVVDSTTLMATIGGVEIFLPRTRLGRALAKMPLLAVLAAKFSVYFAIVVLVVGWRLGAHVAYLTLDPVTAQGIAEQVRSGLPPGLMVAVGALVTSFMLLLRQASQLIGDRTARETVLGRYHRPRIEERFFLFVDIVGSTPVAERLGPLSVHHYLDRIFQCASDPVDDHGGEIYQYVGDEIIVTWTEAEGAGKNAAQGRPLRCFFMMESSLLDLRTQFQKQFAAEPRLRAALHLGEVIAGEVGASRRAIVFHGDVMNTTSRLEQATRELDVRFIASAAALAALGPQPDMELKDLGALALRGRREPIRASGITVRN